MAKFSTRIKVEQIWYLCKKEKVGNHKARVLSRIS